MKLIQISDCHLLAPGETQYGIDPEERLRACIADINRNHSDAAFCVITGDLAHNGDRQSYELLRRCLDDLAVPVHLLPGNHDAAAVLAEVFPEIVPDTEGSVQTEVDTQAGRLLFLDTTDSGSHSGAYGAARLSWLQHRLSETDSNTAVYIFMHHPPLSIEMPRIDQFRLQDSDAEKLGQVLRASGNVRHIYFGHVHRPVCGSWQGIPFSALRGTGYQTAPDFSDGPENIFCLEPAAYAVIFLGPDRTVVHFHDFLDDSPRHVVAPALPEAWHE